MKRLSRDMRGRPLGRRAVLRTAGYSAMGATGLALVGCGDDDDPASSPTTSSGPSTTPSTAGDAPVAGGTLRYPYFGTATADPQTYYPYETVSYAPGVMSGYHYSRLLRFQTGPDISATNFSALAPDLADGLPEQVDEVTYLFRIRDGMRYHDKAPMSGRTATAEDIHAAWQVFSTQGAEAARFTGIVDTLEATDPQTIRITLKEPFAPFLTTIAADNGFWFIPIETINNDQVRSDPVGTGPWVFKGHDSGVAMYWEKHPDHPDAASYYFERLEAGMVWDVQRTTIALIAGDYDFATTDFGEEARLAAEIPDGTFTRWGTLGNSYSWAFNFDNSPWGDKRVRLALSMAMDRAGIANVVDSGTGVSTWSSFLGGGADKFYLDPQSSEFGDNSRFYKQDISEAKKLLEAATGSDSLAGNLYFSMRYGTRYRQHLEGLIGQLAGTGLFRFQLQEQDYGAYIQNTFFGKIADPIGVTYGPTSSTAYEPNDILSQGYWSGSAAHNWSGTPISEQPEIDSKIVAQRGELDPESRLDKIHEIQRFMSESMLLVPGIQTPQLNFHSTVDAQHVLEGIPIVCD